MKSFNVTGACNPEIHYMVNIDQKLQQIKRMVDRGNYFTINRARQYGKTTTLSALVKYLQNDYVVVYLDFQMLSYQDFATEAAFVASFTRMLLRKIKENTRVPERIKKQLQVFTDIECVSARLSELFICLSDWCAVSEQPVILMVDEVDTASNNQIFMDFLAQLRAYFNAKRIEGTATFHSVILAGVHDIKHLKVKINREHEVQTNDKKNSPWNIAADFLVNMSFEQKSIARMLQEYEADYHTGMNVEELSVLIYEYTDGYPFLVSRICNLIDERIAYSEKYPDLSSAWTKSGFLDAIKILLSEKNSLFESLFNKLENDCELKELLYGLLFHGKAIPYTVGVNSIESAEMFGFVKKEQGNAVIANRIFETVLYNLFLTSADARSTGIYKMALQDKNQFVENGHLNMKKILEKFIIHFAELYGSYPAKFLEEDGRRYFLLYLRPIINGTGNYYIEAQTRDGKRTDVIIDYGGEQFIIELKLWNGPVYHGEGEVQLCEYLNYFGVKTGYMLTFNFNKKKEVGIKEIIYGDLKLIEAIV